MSEIQIFAFPFAPKNWALCNGQLMAVATNQALFSLLGTQFGGNGTTTFALPDLRGRTAIGMNGQFPIGAAGGEENHTLVLPEIPAHIHTMVASGNIADQPNADGNLLASGGTQPLFSSTIDNTPLAPNFIGTTGNATPHTNLQPYLVLNYCISLSGIYPSRS